MFFYFSIAAIPNLEIIAHFVAECSGFVLEAEIAITERVLI